MHDRNAEQFEVAEAPGADPVVGAYKRHIDRTLLRQNLRRTVTEWIENLITLRATGSASSTSGTVSTGRLLTDFEAAMRTFTDAGVGFVNLGCWPMVGPSRERLAQRLRRTGSWPIHPWLSGCG